MATCSFLNRLDNARAVGTCGRWLGLLMRNTLIAVALLSAASAHADQSVLTYHGALDRAGRYVVPGLTYERARGLRLDASFHAAFQGKVYAQPLLWRRPGSGERAS